MGNTQTLLENWRCAGQIPLKIAGEFLRSWLAGWLPNQLADLHSTPIYFGDQSRHCECFTYYKCCANCCFVVLSIFWGLKILCFAWLTSGCLANIRVLWAYLYFDCSTATQTTFNLLGSDYPDEVSVLCKHSVPQNISFVDLLYRLSVGPECKQTTSSTQKPFFLVM